MPNAIKYNTSAETLALKKGNFWIGTGDVGKGPTSSTGFYNGLTPPSGGYTIYLNKSTGGPSVYTVITEAQMVSLTNSIGSQSFTTSGQCLNWFATQTDKMIFNRDYEEIVTNGLVLNVDAGFTPSYPTTGTTWYDVSSSSNNGTLTNGPIYNSSNGGSIVFDGVDDYVNLGTTDFGITRDFTVSFWVNMTQTGVMQIFTKGYNVPYGIYISKQSNNTLTCQISLASGSGEVITTTNNYSGITNWTVVRNNTTLTWYINGVINNITSISSFDVSQSNSKQWRIASNFDSALGQLKGNMYSQLVYNRAISKEEIAQNYYAMLNTRMIVTDSLVLNLQAGNLNSYPGSGEVWKDVSGYGNDFTMVNRPTFNSNNTGYIQFDGADDYAYLAVNSSISVGTACSLEMVVKNDYAMRMGQGGAYWAYGFEGAGFSHTCGGNGNISPYFIGAEFHHYVFTWNQAQNNHSMYRDGVLVYSFTPTCGFNAGGGGFFVLGGARGNNGFQSYGSPHIAQLRLYGKILTTSEVEQNFNLVKRQYGL
jgi:hypothetical protein